MLSGNKSFLKFKDLIADLIFPKRCVNCRSYGKFLCEKCVASLSCAPVVECPICRQPNAGGRVCEKCSGKSSLDFLWVLSDYTDLAKNIICQIKYNFVTELSSVFDKLIEEYFHNLQFGFKNILFIPVPLHKRRFLERGFNQSDLIGKNAMRLIGGAIDKNLILRIKYSSSQAKLSAKERAANLAGYFRINGDRAAFYNKQRVVVLVDDIYTTGSTMQECAKLLKKEGFKNVGGLVVARGKRG